MRFFKWLVEIILLLTAGWLLLNTSFIQSASQTAISFWQQATPTATSRKRTSSHSSSALSLKIPLKSSVVSQRETTTSTPTESNVAGKQLAATYYYHFAADVPTSVKSVFTAAVAVYNQTGIVHLTPGEGTAKQNQITFYVYKKKMPENQQQQQLIELGAGGPEIIQRVGWNAFTVNHARAGLNVTYHQAIQRSVAIHELGHALGLDHSSRLDSVMYPVDQGKTVLAPADRKGLREIYP